MILPTPMCVFLPLHLILTVIRSRTEISEYFPLTRTGLTGITMELAVRRKSRQLSRAANFSYAFLALKNQHALLRNQADMFTVDL